MVLRLIRVYRVQEVTMQHCDLTIIEALDGLNKREFTSKELVQSCLQRIDQVDGEINAFITVTKELALDQAEEADKLRAQVKNLPLLGIPVGIKDLYCTKGIETTAGSNILKGFIPPYDATVVKRLKDAGAVIIGKLNQDAFAHGSSGENSDFGITRNPWNQDYVPGGSSSGSGAAVSSGMCLAATGTDTGSSIRLPAAFCNLAGLKNTYGRVSRYGVIAMASSLDCPGVLTRTVEDQALVLKVIAGHDPLDSTTLANEVPNYLKSLRVGSRTVSGRPGKDIRIGIPQEFFVEGIHDKVRELTQQAIERYEKMGFVIEEISLPHTKYGISTYYILCLSEVSSNLARYDGIRYLASMRKGDTIEDLYLDTRGQCFGDEAKRRIMLGTYALSAGYYEAYYDKAQRLRTLVKNDFNEAFKKVDIILAPSSPTPPFKIGEKVDNPLQMYLSDIYLVTVNLAGVPSLNIPCGFVNKLPIGMQLIGPQLSEELLLQVGYTYQQETDWHERRPNVAY